MSKKFSIIVADPPWGGFKDKLSMSNTKRGAAANYNLMTTAQIENIPISDIVENDAILALWVPSALLADGLSVMNNWSFKEKQLWVWVKTKKNPLDKLVKNAIKTLHKENNSIQDIKNAIYNATNNYWFDQLLSFGMGKISRNVHEIVLIGTRGKINSRILDKTQRGVFFHQATRHSVKPELLQDKLDLIFPDPSLNRLEIFGRRLRENWTVIGNQSPSSLGEDIYYSINKLK